ncbi:MAG: ABC transporter permease subunit [Anaeroplasma bactoclasticum]|nr:ABC transporter permease subunit [Anaeroplasma bactoclasticum]
MRHSTTKSKIVSSTLSVSAILLVFFVWMIVSNIYQNDFIFPSIKRIIQAFFRIFQTSSSLKAIGFTCVRVILSVAICFFLGLVITSIYIICPTSIHFFKPIIQMMRSTPLAVISIFIFILIGDKSGPYMITILMSLPVVLEGLITAVDQISTDIIDEVRMLPGNIRQKIKSVYFPITLPYVMMCLIQTLGMSFKVMIMGEYICQTNTSIGKVLYAIKTSIEMDSLLAYGILIVLIVGLLECSIKYLKKRLF